MIKCKNNECRYYNEKDLCEIILHGGNVHIGKFGHCEDSEIGSDFELNFKYVGKWYDDNNIKLIKINDCVYALNKWDDESEKYIDCWECLGDRYDIMSDQKYCITPIREELYDEEGYETVDFIVEKC